MIAPSLISWSTLGDASLAMTDESNFEMTAEVKVGESVDDASFAGNKSVVSVAVERRLTDTMRK